MSVFIYIQIITLRNGDVVASISKFFKQEIDFTWLTCPQSWNLTQVKSFWRCSVVNMVIIISSSLVSNSRSFSLSSRLRRYHWRSRTPWPAATYWHPRRNPCVPPRLPDRLLCTWCDLENPWSSSAGYVRRARKQLSSFFFINTSLHPMRVPTSWSLISSSPISFNTCTVLTEIKLPSHCLCFIV